MLEAKMVGMYNCSTTHPKQHMHLAQTNILSNPNSTSPRVGRDTIIGRNPTFKAVWGILRKNNNDILKKKKKILRKWWKTENQNLQQTPVSTFNVDVYYVINKYFVSCSSFSWIQISLHTEFQPCRLSRTAIVDLGCLEVVDLWLQTKANKATTKKNP